MNTPPNKRESLEQLRRELDSTHAATENDTTRTMLGGVKDELQRVLTLPDAEQIEHHESLSEQLQDAAVHVEADHPTLAATLRAAIEILSNSGV